MDLNDAWTMRSIHVDARYIVPQACSMIPVRGRVHPHLGNRAARWCVSAESRRPLCVDAGIDDPLQGLTIVAVLFPFGPSRHQLPNRLFNWTGSAALAKPALSSATPNTAPTTTRARRPPWLSEAQRPERLACEVKSPA